MYHGWQPRSKFALWQASSARPHRGGEARKQRSAVLSAWAVRSTDAGRQSWRTTRNVPQYEEAAPFRLWLQQVDVSAHIGTKKAQPNGTAASRTFFDALITARRSRNVTFEWSLHETLSDFEPKALCLLNVESRLPTSELP